MMAARGVNSRVKESIHIGKTVSIKFTITTAQAHETDLKCMQIDKKLMG